MYIGRIIKRPLRAVCRANIDGNEVTRSMLPARSESRISLPSSYVLPVHSQVISPANTNSHPSICQPAFSP